MRSIIFVLPLMLWLSGCATMDETECKSADWYKVGVVDGKRGLPSDFLNQHLKACAASGRDVAVNEWTAGREEGLKEYCTPGVAYVAGSSGKNYQNVCPKEVEDEFLKQFAAGRQTYALKMERNEVREEKKRRQEQIDKDHSVVGDVSKAFHLLAGTSPTEDYDRRDERLTNQIVERNSNAPVSRLALEPQVSMTGLESMSGAMLGTVMGFGLGHAAQGHWSVDGKKWTAIDASMITTIAVLGHNCPGNTRTEARGSFEAMAAGDCNLLVPMWFVGFLTARVWQSVELWTHTRRAFSPYQEKKPSAFFPEYVSTVPVSDTMGVGAGWAFN